MGCCLPSYSKKMHDSAKTIPASIILHDLKENLYF